MSETEQIDFILRGMYVETREGGMMYLDVYLNTYQERMSPQEKQDIVSIIKNNSYGVLQSVQAGYKLAITAAGVQFVETNSFSNPGTSILNL